MNIQIVSKNIDVSPALLARINERFDEMMDKYIHREGEAHVSVSREGSGFRTICAVHLPSGTTMESSGNAKDAYGATDEALEHMEKRLRRYKRRLKDHQAQQKAHAKADALAMFVMKNPVLESELDDDSEHADAPAEPMIISEATRPIRTMTPGMAALEVGLTDNGFLIFNNAKHGRMNVVFKRPDGNIGWIDPKV